MGCRVDGRPTGRAGWPSGDEEETEESRGLSKRVPRQALQGELNRVRRGTVTFTGLIAQVVAHHSIADA